jgi:AraC family transcriptional regulator
MATASHDQVPAAHGGTHGARLRCTDVPGFRLTETRHHPGVRLGAHLHEHACVVCVLDGGFVERLADHSYDCARGDVLLRPAGAVHEDRFDAAAGARCLILEILPEPLGQRPLVARLLSEPARTRRGPEFGLARRLQRALWAQDALAPLAIEGLALELFVRLARDLLPAEPAMPTWLASARAHLHERRTDLPTLRELAELCGVHPVSLARAFRKHHGCTVGEYLRRLRVEQATERLASSDDSLSAIALEVGFADFSHFARVFKRETGTTPGRFRRSLGRG